MAMPEPRKYFIISAIFHGFLLLVLGFSWDMTSPLPVIENTNKNDVISAVVLGDTEKSKILTQQSLPSITPQKIPDTASEAAKRQVQIDKEVIALKAATNKKLAQQKAEELKKQRDLLAKDLLADIKKLHDKQKKIKQKKLTSQFEKTLRQQAEKSLRQQLLNEEIKLQGTENRAAQGEVNKFKALILQAISEHWLIPTQANKKLSCELMIRLAPGGMVLDVQITKSSGDVALDSSARAAVLKASPLPVPKNTEAFESFRQFVLKVKPENILNNGNAVS